jgi:dTDP-4-amino-4,6-dideoxygalactose transaminase
MRQEVPFLDLKSVHRQLAAEILDSWRSILEDAAFIGGPSVELFEKEFASFVGARYCVGIANGTDALRLALVAMGLQPGDEVITVPHTFIATTEAITQAGGRIVFVDVDAQTGTMSPEALERAITEKTRFIVPVHLYGQAAEMEPILAIAKRHGIQVLSDACQAQGATYLGRDVGTLGRASAYSFYPGKNLGACGEAGAVTTDDAEIAAKLRMLREHGQPKKYYHDIEGYNARLDALQAAALRIKLRHLSSWNEQRRAVAAQYRQRLNSLPLELPAEASGRKHVYHLYVVRHPEREQLRVRLGELGIATGMHYPVPLHLQKAYEHMKLRAGSFPESERWAAQGLSLPMFPGLSEAQVDAVCNGIRAALA